ncbi:hypothetical protein, partial [Streptosporangium fragile]|uniref:hypothetical protein n=1 Tax=Streptosporangium fragile TaxID=46186 RepID=UPI0031F08293
MSVVRAGVLALLIGVAAVGATQHSKPAGDRSPSWSVKRPGDAVAGRHWGRAAERPGNWVSRWTEGWRRPGKRASQRSWQRTPRWSADSTAKRPRSRVSQRSESRGVENRALGGMD